MAVQRAWVGEQDSQIFEERKKDDHIEHRRREEDLHAHSCGCGEQEEEVYMARLVCVKVRRLKVQKEKARRKARPLWLLVKAIKTASIETRRICEATRRRGEEEGAHELKLAGELHLDRGGSDERFFLLGNTSVPLVAAL